MLRDYQQNAVDATRQAREKSRANGQRFKGVLGACVGAGKSHIIADIAGKESGRTIVLTHSSELVEQDAAKIEESGMHASVFCASSGRKENTGQIVVASIQSFARDPMIAGGFALICIDEAHRVPPHEEGQYKRVLAAHAQADCLGLTGTPWRLNSGAIYGPGKFFEELVYEISIEELQSKGWLVPIKTRCEDRINANIHVQAGEYRRDEQEAALALDGLAGQIMRDRGMQRYGIIFSPGVSTGIQITEMLKAAGVRACWVDGTTPAEERKRYTQEFREGQWEYLVNCECLTTGFDAPLTDHVVLLRRSMSTALLIQMIGRGLRLSPDTGKEFCRVLDYAGNFDIHPPIECIGPPGDGEEKPPIGRRCLHCQAINKPAAKICAECGEPFPPPQQKPKELELSGARDGVTAAGLTQEDRRKIAFFAKVANVAVQRNWKPIAVALKFKDEFGEWPTPKIGHLARHPFRWVAGEGGKKTIAWGK
jgi:DNA repair protein RadD